MGQDDRERFSEEVKRMSAKNEELRQARDRVSAARLTSRTEFLLQFDEVVQDHLLPAFAAIRTNAGLPSHVVRIEYLQNEENVRLHFMGSKIEIRADLEHMRVEFTESHRRDASLGAEKSLTIEELREHLHGLLKNFLRRAWGLKKEDWEE